MKSILYWTVYPLQSLLFILIKEILHHYAVSKFDGRLMLLCENSEFRHYYTWESQALKLFYLFPLLALGFGIYDNDYTGFVFFLILCPVVSIFRIIEYFIKKEYEDDKQTWINFFVNPWLTLFTAAVFYWLFWK